MLFSQAMASDVTPITVTQWQLHGSSQWDTQCTRHGTNEPTLRIWRDANAADPQVISEDIQLPDTTNAWLIGGWLKMQEMIYRDPSFNVALFAQWLDAQQKPVGHEQLMFSSFDVQRQNNLSTRSGSTIAFDWTYQQALLNRPHDAVAMRLSFRFNQGQAVAWLTDVTLRHAEIIDQRLGKQNVSLDQQPELRLRNGSFPLDDNRAENLPLFTPEEALSMTVMPLNGPWDAVQFKLRDSDGGLLWVTDLPAGKQPLMVQVPITFTQQAVGQCLTFSAQYKGKTANSQITTVNVGIMPQRLALHHNAQLASPFGMVTSISSTQPRDMAMLKRIGIQWVRHRGIRWRQDSPEKQQDILHSQYVDEMLTLQDAGFLPLIQTFATSAPKWVHEPGMVHRGKKPSIKPDAFADWITQLGDELPMFTHIKLLNERDRDSRPDYLKHYAHLMQAGYSALKKQRPDCTISVEGGFTPEISQILLDAGLYEHADVIDHHLYGDVQLVLELQERLKRMYAAGYHQPVIASEFGVVPGDGSPNVTSRQIANGLIQNASTWLAIGGKQFFWFIWGTLGPESFDRQFENLYMVDRHGSQPQLPLFAYALLSEQLEGARPLLGPQFDKNLRQMVFKRNDGKRVDVVWAEGPYAAAQCISTQPLTVIQSTGKRYKLTPASDGMLIQVDQNPVLIVSSGDTQVTATMPMMVNDHANTLIEAGGLLDVPSIKQPQQNISITPLLPIGWQRQPQLPNKQWRIHPASQTPLGSYTMAWQLTDAQQNVRALVFDKLQLIPALSAQVMGDAASNGKSITVQLQNLSANDWSGKVRLICPPDQGMIPQSKTWSLTVPGHGDVNLPWTLPTAIAEDWQNDPHFTVQMMDTSGQVNETDARCSFHVVYKAKQGITIDGDLQDWDGVPRMPLMRNTYQSFSEVLTDIPQDDQDLSATAMLQHGKNWIAFAVEVRDDLHLNDKPANQIWAADSVEFTLGIRPDNQPQVPDDYYKIAMALTDKGPVAYGFRSPAGRPWAQGALKAGKFAVRRTEDGRTIYELIIGYGPLRLHHTDGISFALSVNESDHMGKREGILRLFDGVSKTQDASRHGWFSQE
jgi:hypothetical protein